MRAILVKEFGDAEVMQVGEVGMLEAHGTGTSLVS